MSKLFWTGKSYQLAKNFEWLSFMSLTKDYLNVHRDPHCCSFDGTDSHKWSFPYVCAQDVFHYYWEFYFDTIPSCQVNATHLKFRQLWKQAISAWSEQNIGRIKS